MADNFILSGARQDGSNLGVVIAATNNGSDSQGRPILSLAVSAAAGGATSAKQDTQITAEQAILAALNARLGKGAANLATAQVTSTGTAATLAIARSTRRSILFTNTHATGSVWIGPATVTSSNGQKLGPGQSCPFTWVGLFQIIDDASTHCVVIVADEYD